MIYFPKENLPTKAAAVLVLGLARTRYRLHRGIPECLLIIACGGLVLFGYSDLPIP